MKRRAFLQAVACTALLSCVRVPGHPVGAAALFPYPNPYWNQSEWDIDPSNTSGCASDANNCSTQTCGSAGSNQGPCLTPDQLYVRWQGDSPLITTSTVRIRFMSAMTGPGQHFHFHPNIGFLSPTAGPTITIECNLPAASNTGTLSSLVAKTRTGSTPGLSASLGVTGLIPGSMIVNTTRANSVAWLDFKGAGTTWNLSQPFAPVSLPLSGGGLVGLAENDTWASTDTWQVIIPLSVWINDVRPTQLGTSELGIVQIVNCRIPEDTAATVNPGDDPFIMGPWVQAIQTSIQRMVVVSQTTPLGSQSHGLMNVSMDGGFAGGLRDMSSAPNSETFNIYGGRIYPGNSTSGGLNGTGYVGFGGVWLDGDVIIHNASNTSASPVTFSGYNAIGFAQLTTTAQVLNGLVDLKTLNNFGGNKLYGTANGILDAYMGTVLYSATTTAATTFTLSGGIAIQGGTVACCNTVANPSVENCNITLSQTALGAGACSSATPALGNRAFLPGAGAFIGL